MSQLTEVIHKNLRALAQLRDELALQVDLMKAEARSEWNDLEMRWEPLKAQLTRIEEAAEYSKIAFDESVRETINELHDEYLAIKRKLSE